MAGKINQEMTKIEAASRGGEDHLTLSPMASAVVSGLQQETPTTRA